MLRRLPLRFATATGGPIQPAPPYAACGKKLYNPAGLFIIHQTAFMQCSCVLIRQEFSTVRYLPIFVFVLCAVSLASCTGCGSGAPGGDVLVYGRGADADTLDPINTDNGESVKVIMNIYDQLLTYDDETLELVPSLSTSLGEHTEDGLTWTFPLRKDVKFHDGSPFKADAVVFSFNRLIQSAHPHVHDKARPYASNFKVIESVTAKDDFTVVFKLKHPSAVFRQNLAMFPASIVNPGKVMELKEEYRSQPSGTGPFMLQLWEPGSKIALQRFEDHWRGPAGVGQVIFLPVSESATRIQLLERAQIDIADNLPPPALDQVVKRDGIEEQSVDALNIGYLCMQNDKPPLNNVKVRRAIAHAIDKKYLVKIGYGGHATPAVNMVPRNMKEWHNNEIKDRKFDLEKAKALMKQAAAEDNLKLPVTLTLAVMSRPRPYMQQPLPIATVIKDALAKIGIKIKVQMRNVHEHFDYMMAGNHELGLAGWSSDNNDPDNFLYSLLDIDNISSHGNNMSRFRSQPLHKLLIAGQRELDPAERHKLYMQAQQIIFEEAPVIPLVSTKVRIARTARVKGYVLHPSSLVRLRNVRIRSAP